jgi:hypothetical protein
VNDLVTGILLIVESGTHESGHRVYFTWVTTGKYIRTVKIED